MLQETTINEAPRADLINSDFEKLIQQKGREVILEKSLVCPCKSKDSNQLSTCKNCGGIGYFFVNPKKTRMVLTGVDAHSKLQGWSEELQGVVSITCSATEELTHMDRITVVDADSFFQEVLHFKKTSANQLFAYTAYTIKELKYIGMFVNVNSALTRLVYGEDYTYENKTIKLADKYVQGTAYDEQDISITIRYKHSPIFYVLEMRRETMQSFKVADKGEELQHMPVSAYGKRAHYIPGYLDSSGTKLIDNSYDTGVGETVVTFVSPTIIVQSTGGVSIVMQKGQYLGIGGETDIPFTDAPSVLVSIATQGIHTLTEVLSIDDLADLTYFIDKVGSKIYFGTALGVGELVTYIYTKQI